MTTGVTVDFNANLARFTSAIDKATNDLNKFQSNTQRISANIGRAFGALGVGLSVAGLVAFNREIINTADETAKLSQRLGIGIKDLAAWQLAADLGGASIESVGKAVKGLATYLVDYGDQLRGAGITATDANGALLELADLFASLPDGLEKTALATKLFGKAGLDLIPVLNQGSAGLRDMQEKSRSYGETLAKMAPDAEKFNDQLTELAFQGKSAATNLTALVIGPLAEFATWLNDLASGGERAERALEFLSEKSPLFKGAVEFNKLAGRAAALMGAGGDESGRSRSGNIAGGAADLAAFDAATEAYMKEREALARAQKIVGKGEGSGKSAGKAGKSALQKMLDLAAERQLGMIDSGEGGLSVATVAGQDAAKAAADNTERLNTLLAATPSGQLAKAREEMQFLADALVKGTINEEQFTEAVGMHYGKATEAMDEMSQFAIEAARNMQDAMADGFFDIMQGKFDNLGATFKATIDRMVANAVAADLGKRLLGDMGKTGEIGGWVGQLRGSFGGGYGDVAGVAAGVPQFAEGTPYVKRSGLAVIHEGEAVLTKDQNRRGFGGTINITINGSNNAPDVRRAAGQGAREALAAFAGAQRYG